VSVFENLSKTFPDENCVLTSREMFLDVSHEYIVSVIFVLFMYYHVCDRFELIFRFLLIFRISFNLYIFHKHTHTHTHILRLLVFFT